MKGAISKYIHFHICVPLCCFNVLQQTYYFYKFKNNPKNEKKLEVEDKCLIQ